MALSPQTHTLRTGFSVLPTIGLVVLFLLSASLALAQVPVRAVPVTGTLFDPSGAGVANVTVSLKQGADTVVASVETDTAGRFRFDAVAEGSYFIVAEHEGFAPSVTPLQVRNRPPAPLTIKLALASLVSEVTVNGDAPVIVSTDIAENKDSVSLDQNLLEQVPIFDQDYVTAISAFLDSGSIGTSGPQLVVNGVQVTTLAVSASAIQQVTINQNPYTADMARPGRGSIEITTKDPTTKYHGTFNFIFRDAVFNGRDPFALVRGPEQRRIWEGALTGPIWQSKKTSFVLSGHRQEEDLVSIVSAVGVSGPIQENVLSPKRDTQLSTQVYHQFSEKRTIFGQYNEWDYPSKNQGVGGFVLPEAGTNLDQWEREWVYGDRWAPSSNWLSQFQLLIGWEHHSTVSVTNAPQIVVQHEFTGGGAQQNILNTEKHFQLSELVSWSRGKHFVKFGVQLPDFSYRGIFNQNNVGGTYFFKNLVNYQNQIPSTFKEQAGSGHVTYWQKELGGFVQDDYRIRQNLSLSLGLRYNWQNVIHDEMQFAPRLAFAYSPDKKRKTVLRGGAGIFYDRTGAGPLGDILLYNGQVLQTFLVYNPSYPNPGPLGPTGTVQLDPAIREPYSLQYSFAVERQLAKRTTLAVTYYGSLGVDLFRSHDINAPLPPDYNPLNVPNPALGVVRQIESAGRQVGNSLEITLRGDLAGCGKIVLSERFLPLLSLCEP
jgi:Carboxypeptidase regulatory-like domain/TonB dependent receptor